MNWPIDRIHPFPQIFPLSNCRKVSPSQYFAASHSKKIIKDCNLFTRCGVESQKSIAKYRNALGRRDRDHIGNHNGFTERFFLIFFSHSQKCEATELIFRFLITETKEIEIAF